MQIHSEKASALDAICARLERSKERYKAVQKATGVPWFVVAALHNRESDGDFSTYLGNGDLLSRPTVNVPEGRGPFASWQEGAIDALAYDGLNKITNWSAPRACYEIEKFNGFGYRHRGVPSPYLWSWSSNYACGKYVRDGLFDPSAVDKQCGAMPIVKRLMERNKEVWQDNRALEHTAAGGAAAGGIIVAATAAQNGVHPVLIGVIAFVFLVLTLFIWHTIHNSKQ